jgi:hypothetical protein
MKPHRPAFLDNHASGGVNFRNPRPTSLSFRARRQSAVEAAASFSELDPHHARPARSGFGAAKWSILAAPPTTPTLRPKFRKVAVSSIRRKRD